ncbi:PAS domain S-box-containing protein/diguanylate cyclase (GGDEF)-like protein [Azospirillum brasilense]|uniref:PAS domain S-box-containing protein/diguanylate cyclase (GGDEF)-like protein n=2 Tax=Azospirillum brasilense TaxID=192 RepID=A0A560CLI6_AZOBR|nr:PAS domain S-box-containing protein/diguanylate cyclase (GGDEF)-like protein [Azospirillum brasilense]
MGHQADQNQSGVGAPGEEACASTGRPMTAPMTASMTVADLPLLDGLWAPVWLQDGGRMLWGNRAALELWNAASLADFQTRDFGSQPEDAPQAEGETAAGRWTFYPKGRPVAAWVRRSGMALPDGRLGILHEAQLAAPLADPDHGRTDTEALDRERAMLQSLIDSMPDIVFFKDVNGTYLKVNRAMLDYAGRPPLGLTDHRLFDAETAVRRRRTDQIAMQKGFSRSEEWFVHPDGRRVLMETAKAVCLDRSGKMLGVVGIARDITERRQTEKQLLRQHALLQGIIDTIPDAVFFKDRDGVLRKANRAFASWTGRPLEQLIGLDSHEIWPDEMADGIRAGDASVYAEGQPRRNEESIPLPDGGRIWVEILKAPIRDAGNELLGLVGVGRDITLRKAAEEDLRRSEAEKDHLANHDALTGLPNRRLLFDRLDVALVRSRRSGRSLALLFIDLDGFKAVNDRMGHDCGDEVLRIAAARIAGCLRRSDTVARVGGDEFTIVLEDVTSAADAGGVAAKIVEAVALPIPVQGMTAVIGASVGIALSQSDGSDARSLLVAADGAMYRAKQAGRGTHVFYKDILRKNPD